MGKSVSFFVMDGGEPVTYTVTAPDMAGSGMFSGTFSVTNGVRYPERDRRPHHGNREVPVTPEPVTPEPVTPEPVTPEPVTPDYSR